MIKKGMHVVVVAAYSGQTMAGSPGSETGLQIRWLVTYMPLNLQKREMDSSLGMTGSYCATLADHLHVEAAKLKHLTGTTWPVLDGN